MLILTRKTNEKIKKAIETQQKKISKEVLDKQLNVMGINIIDLTTSLCFIYFLLRI